MQFDSRQMNPLNALAAVALAALLASAACGDNLDPPGLTPPDAAPGAPDVDASGPDAAVADAMVEIDAGANCPVFAPIACSDSSPCASADEQCIAGACVAACADTPADLADGLGASGTVLANVCVPAPALRAVQVSNAGGCEQLTAYDVSVAVDDATDIAAFTVERFPIEPDQDIPAANTVGTAEVQLEAGVSLFPSGYLALAPIGTAATEVLFGYTLSSAGFPGEVIHLDAGGAPSSLASDGNFGAVWLDDEHYLISGLSTGPLSAGHGLYHVDVSGAAPVVKHIVTGLGDFSGSVAIDRGRGLVIVGGFFSDFVSRVFVIPVAEIDAAVAADTPLDASDTAAIPRFEIPSDFLLVGRQLVSFDFTANEYQAREVMVAGDGAVTLAAPVRFAGAPITGLSAVADGGVLLHHAGGSLLVDLGP